MLENPGNKYLFFNMVIPGNTEKYSLSENNPDKFPNWNKNWHERRYFNVFAIKTLDEDISVSFHQGNDEEIIIHPEDTPLVLEEFIFRDVYFSNYKSSSVSFELILLSQEMIQIPPNKPINLRAEIVDTDNVKLLFDDDSEAETYFVIERSDVSATEGFGILDKKKYLVEQIVDIMPREYIDSTTVSGGTYWYRIKAEKDGIDSLYTEVVEINV